MGNIAHIIFRDDCFSRLLIRAVFTNECRNIRQDPLLLALQTEGFWCACRIWMQKSLICALCLFLTDTLQKIISMPQYGQEICSSRKQCLSDNYQRTCVGRCSGLLPRSDFLSIHQDALRKCCQTQIILRGVIYFQYNLFLRSEGHRYVLMYKHINEQVTVHKP